MSALDHEDHVARAPSRRKTREAWRELQPLPKVMKSQSNRVQLEGLPGGQTGALHHALPPALGRLAGPARSHGPNFSTRCNRWGLLARRQADRRGNFCAAAPSQWAPNIPLAYSSPSRTQLRRSRCTGRDWTCDDRPGRIAGVLSSIRMKDK